MKTLQLFFLLMAMTVASVCFAQSKTETIPVAGNCDMCKSTIEKAAKKAGATQASWDAKAQALTVSYNSASSNAARIQQGIAAAGYDTRDFKASDEAYNKLHGCCKYERKDAAKTSCCSGEKCKEHAKAGNCCGEKCDMKDGKCTDMSACKEKDCCSGGACEKKP